MTSTTMRMTVFLAAVAFSACSDQSTDPAVERCEAQTASLLPTVTTGSSVIFNWEPQCGVMMLGVEPPDSAQDSSDRWFIWTDEQTWGSPEQANLIFPPVTYGIRPAASPNSNGPEPLLAGREYDLILWRQLPMGRTDQCLNDSGTACLVTLYTFVR